jgi:hypothetical protein
MYSPSRVTLVLSLRHVMDRDIPKRWDTIAKVATGHISPSTKVQIIVGMILSVCLNVVIGLLECQSSCSTVANPNMQNDIMRRDYCSKWNKHSANWVLPYRLLPFEITQHTSKITFQRRIIITRFAVSRKGNKHGSFYTIKLSEIVLTNVLTSEISSISRLCMDKAIITGKNMVGPSISLATPSVGDNYQRFSHQRKF